MKKNHFEAVNSSCQLYDEVQINLPAQSHHCGCLSKLKLEHKSRLKIKSNQAPSKFVISIETKRRTTTIQSRATSAQLQLTPADRPTGGAYKNTLTSKRKRK